MSTILEISYPNSFKRFKCLGGNCEDTCCKVWDIEIDKDTFEQYSKINNSQMKFKLNQWVCKSEKVVSNDLNYGVIKLKENGKLY